MGRFSLLHNIVIGARKSTLAKLQAYSVGSEMAKLFPQYKIEYKFQESAGDKDLTSPLWKMEGKGVFTRDLQVELIENRIHCIVHSWKDLDLEEREETEVISVLPREDQRDLLLFKRSVWNGKPPEKLIFCTSSPRREFNLAEFLPSYLPSRYKNSQISFEPIRGNIQTRIKKFLEGNSYSGLIVAKAALDRLLLAPSEFKGLVPEDDYKEFVLIADQLRSYLDQSLPMILPLSANPNAPAQGALAVEFLKSSKEFKTIFSKLTDRPTSECTIEERKILGKFGGGCHQKIGVAIQEKSYGKVQFLRGLTDSGIKLSEMGIQSRSKKSFAREEVWPPEGKILPRSRKRINSNIPANKDLFIARSFALPQESIGTTWNQDPTKTVIWTAGLSTWRDLAEQDLWVHGSTDSLGESEPSFLDNILGRELDFVKLTHKDSPPDNGNYPIHATYEVGEPEIPEDFDPTPIKAAYWRSGTEFDSVTKKFPELRDVTHYSGVGSTLEHIKKNGLEVEAFLSLSDWLNHISNVRNS